VNPMRSKQVIYALLLVFSMTAHGQSSDTTNTTGATGYDVQSNSSPAFEEAPVDAATDELVRAALKRLNPNLDPEYIGRSPVPGYHEVIIKGQVAFVTEDGSYLIQGLLDLRNERDVAQFGALPGRRRNALAKIPGSERIVFAPAGELKHTVTVFTDVECGFCRKMHQDVVEYNKLGIAIEYVAFPRAGIGSEDALKMETVWCSNDRRKAMTEAKNGATLPKIVCENPVSKHFEIGQHLGLQGTPMIINSDGITISGYLPPSALLDQLEKLAAQRKTK